MKEDKSTSRVECHRAKLSVPVLGLPQDDSKGASADRKTLLDPSSHSNLGAAGGNAEVLAVNPHASGAVVDLVSTRAQRTKGVGNVAGNADVLVRIAAR